MPAISSVSSMEIFNSGGNPTILTTVKLSDGTTASSSVALSHAKGNFEAKDSYDQDQARFQGKGMLRGVTAVSNIIQEKLNGVEVFEQQKIDGILNQTDGTENKSKLGANVMLSVSQAVAKAAAKASSIPLFLYLRQFTSIRENAIKLPLPMITLVEGGKWIKGSIDFQGVLLLPASSQDAYSSLEMGIEIVHLFEKFLEERNAPTLNAPLGGFSAVSQTNTNALGLLKQFIESTPYKFSEDVFLGVDVNANSFVNGQSYRIIDKANPISSAELIEYYKSLVHEFAVIFLEDAFSDTDEKGWEGLYSALSEQVIISGDDLIGGSPLRLQSSIEGGLLNAISFNPGQIGTVSESLAFAEIARYKKLKIVIFDRGYTTDDTFLTDFAVAVGADYFKAGAPLRERIIKYNRLLEIDKEVDMLR